jgi:hypothetical protein
VAKISAYSALTNVQPDDLLVVVDVNDTSMAPTGTTKNMTLSQLAPLQPWQFLPESYGAVGNGKVISDVVLNSTTTMTSATAAFTPADTGKTIMINGAIGSTNIPLVTTITYSSATQVTLGTTATVSGSGFVAVYGTDDTSAMASCAAAGKTYATTFSSTSPGSGSYFFEVIFGAKIYMLTSGPTQATSPQTNAQVVIPWPNVNGTSRKLVVQLTGAGDAGFAQFWESTTPNVAGTALVSTLTSAPSTPSGTFGEQSVIGGPSGGGAFTGGYANVKVVVQGIEVVCPCYTNMFAYDFGYCSAMRVQQSSAHIFAPSGVNGGQPPVLNSLPSESPAFLNTIGAGLRSPVTGNNDDVVMDDFTVEGYPRSLYVFDHFTAGRVCSVYSNIALTIDLTQGVSGTSHGVFIALFSAEVYNGGILTVGSSSYCPVYINLDAECGSVAYDVSDAGNVLYGEIHWTDPADTRAPTISGAGTVRIVNDKLAPGQWTGGMTPAVPAVAGSGTAVTNIAYRDASVYLTSGGAAVTVIKVDSVTTGLTLGTAGTVMYRVPSGHATTLTYASSAPTWAWVLE